MNIDVQFPVGRFLKSEEIPAAGVALTISRVTGETLGEGAEAEHKPVLWFTETTKGLVVNVTNRNNLKAAFGPETDSWIGQQVVLVTEPTFFQGKARRGIRIYRAPQPSPVAIQPAAIPLAPSTPPPVVFSGAAPVATAR